MITSRRSKCVGHAAGLGDIRIDTQFQSEKLKGRNFLGDIGVDGRIILK
jgi:hypothetical protein